MSLSVYIITLFILFIFSDAQQSGYKPVVMFHGFENDASVFDTMIAMIQQAHPDTLAVSLPVSEGVKSVIDPMWVQIAGVRQAINQLKQTYPTDFENGFHLVCHSQGALVCRGYIMTTNDHGVVNYVSLAGPQLGQFGVIHFMKDFFPHITTEIAWIALYSSLVQDAFTPANYWNDPFHQPEYLTDVKFLPQIDNQTANPNATEYKKNFLQLNTAVFVGSPEDGTIQPWQSSFFGFWAENSWTDLVSMQNQTVYKEDVFGLRTLDESGKLIMNVVQNVTHNQWLINKALFLACIEPYLT
eukprot:TRINITY_DN579_c0_g1_i5.p1 TRINITY_DN579_c0_g1~~TRINITY_DN579_c0_g1_i5.p1  ORF type:complete len:299 (-),score=43.17 TRINITY_DN579_c0_g1_i5:63-959(-)